jgi:hypothetical protein
MVLSVILVVGVSVVVSAPAQGATTLGQTDPAAPAGYACGSPTAYLQSAVAAGSPTYYVPAGGGVITSWSTQANANADKEAELKVFAATGTPGSYLVRGQEGPHILAPGVLNTFPAQVPVEAGDVLGLYHGTIGTACGFDGVPGDTTSSVFAAIPDPPVGSTYTPNMNDAGFRVNISAQLEPDADDDGFGDESQDKCAGTAGPFNGCPSSVALNKVKQKGMKPKVKLTVTVPGAGTLSAGSPSDPAVAAAAAAKSLKAVTRTLTSTAKRTLVLTLKLTKSAKRRLSDKGKLKTKVKVLYTPAGGPAAAASGKAKLRS